MNSPISGNTNRRSNTAAASTNTASASVKAEDEVIRNRANAISDSADSVAWAARRKSTASTLAKRSASATISLGHRAPCVISSRRRQPAVEGKLRLVHAPDGETAGRTWDLGESRSATVTLGNGRDCPVALTGDPTLLPKMALIRAERGADGQIIPWLIDLSGTGAAQVKGKPHSSRQALADGDVIQLGAYQLRYENLSLHRNAQAWRPPARKGWSK